MVNFKLVYYQNNQHNTPENTLPLPQAHKRLEILKLKPRGQRAFLPLLCAKPLIDLRMEELGLCRHPLQPDTPADGNCTVWSAAVQLVPTSTTLDLAFIQTFREEVVQLLPEVLETELLSWVCLAPAPDMTPEQWMAKMVRPGEYADLVWLQLLAIRHDSDVMVFPCFPEPGWEGGFHRLLGGSTKPEGSEVRSAGRGRPVLLVLTEEEYFLSGHFQVGRLCEAKG